ncbi:MAG: hypothetical protein IJZ00_07400 [Lachnospiraceae bacterium]|nr:hypothetical protein [Lachnospiraceae bacterium]
MADNIELEKKKIQEEKKKLKREQDAQRKEAKKKAKALARQEAELDDSGSGFSTFMVTLFIILIWIAILCILVKLDVGGFGSNVLTPILKDVPVINRILPADPTTETEDLEAYYGYTSLADAVERIRVLEMELASAQSMNTTNLSEIEQMKAEITRLQTFEAQQVEFQRIKTEFYEEVIYAENGPGPEAYQEYFESMDPATAEYLYQQVIQDLQVDSQMSEYAEAYAAMEPEQAAGIFNTMTNNIELVGEILWAMDPADRGLILGAMDPDMAAQVTKIMNPEN